MEWQIHKTKNGYVANYGIPVNKIGQKMIYYRSIRFDEEQQAKEYIKRNPYPLGKIHDKNFK